MTHQTCGYIRAFLDIKLGKGVVEGQGKDKGHNNIATIQAETNEAKSSDEFKFVRYGTCRQFLNLTFFPKYFYIPIQSN